MEFCPTLGRSTAALSCESVHVPMNCRHAEINAVTCARISLFWNFHSAPPWKPIQDCVKEMLVTLTLHLYAGGNHGKYHLSAMILAMKSRLLHPFALNSQLRGRYTLDTIHSALRINSTGMEMSREIVPFHSQRNSNVHTRYIKLVGQSISLAFIICVTRTEDFTFKWNIKYCDNNGSF